MNGPGSSARSTIFWARASSRRSPTPPTDAEAERLFKSALNQHRRGNLGPAADLYGQVLGRDATHAGAWANLGVALRALGKAKAAAACHTRALALKPDEPGTLSNLANALREIGRFDLAETALNRATQLRPGAAEYWNNLGLVMRDSNRPDAYLKWIEKALELRPDYPEAQWERALALLTLGDYGRGLPAYEARWGLERSPPRIFDKPRWDGQPLSGQTLFLHDEQGFGDAIQFARFAAQAAARGARVVLECQPELMRLFATLPGVAELVARGAPAPAFDCYAPLLSLPGLFGTTLDTLPALVPYLTPPEDRPVVLPGERRRKIGLVWAGKTTPRDRSVALTRLIDLMGDPRLAFYGLQVGPRAADIQAEAAGALITDLSAHLTDFAATAAVLSQLDLLVTIDTAIAHLAGAMGVPTYVLLLYHSDWRWGAGGTATPWYPSLKLFRQARFDDWQAPLLDVARDLRRVAEGQPPLG